MMQYIFKKTFYSVIIILIIMLSQNGVVLSDELSSIIDFNLNFQPVKVSEALVEPPSEVLKLKNGHYLYSIPLYLYEVLPVIPQNILKTFLVEQVVLVGELPHGNRLWIDKEKLKELTDTGKRVKLYRPKERIYDAELLPDNKIMYTAYDQDNNLELMDLSGTTIWRKKFPVEKLSLSFMNTVIAIKPERRTIVELNTKGDVLEEFSLDYPVKTILKLARNRYLLLKQDQEEVLVVDTRGNTLLKLEGMSAIFNIARLDNNHFTVIGRTTVHKSKMITAKFAKL